MTPADYAGYRFPSDVIQRAVWVYLRFTLSYRDGTVKLLPWFAGWLDVAAWDYRRPGWK